MKKTYVLSLALLFLSFTAVAMDQSGDWGSDGWGSGDEGAPGSSSGWSSVALSGSDEEAKIVLGQPVPSGTKIGNFTGGALPKPTSFLVLVNGDDMVWAQCIGVVGARRKGEDTRVNVLIGEAVQSVNLSDVRQVLEEHAK